ncbi:MULTISPECIES: hypothetical protein [Staphylococcus]|uniref:Uncharacterized protein n=6 Tax=Bacillales TaxID=1385 RepID=A0A640N6C3_BACAN|nr:MULTISPECIES: hypothetical protein [Staphylococcus]MDU2096670.1 ATP-binding protein [Staphylococcus sp.]GEU19830.1 hypothetical protein LamDB_51180 [Bacillus anthracis]AKC75050.1 hypothetical protein ShL2_00163 [Staphylococcus haemolyticus]EZI39073.1 hypothetical protein BW32_02189 [Staphylococcus haemolyticus]KKI58212.1 hypothetical protein UF69_1554 [Staphylococcus haemolyticus]
MSRQSRKDKKELKGLAENLLVDYELRNQANDNLDKSLHNIDVMRENIDNQINMKKDLLNELRNRRLNNTQLQDSNLTKFNDEVLKNKLRDGQIYASKSIDLVETNSVKTIDIDRDDFNSYEYNRQFALENNIDLTSPFLNLYSKHEQVEVARKMIEKFDLLELEKEDYGFAACAALIAGIVDCALVGTISHNNPSVLQKKVDEKFYSIVQKYSNNRELPELKAKFEKVQSRKDVSSEYIKKLENKIKAIENGTQSRKDMVGYLEKTYRVKYDAVHDKSIAGMYVNNHHNASLAHDFSPLGLLVGIMDQLTGKSTFISAKTGEISRIATNNKNTELQGNIIQKIIGATNNWFGHCMSDIVGSSGSKGRGQGLPAPFWSYLQKLNFGKVKLSNNKELSIGQLTDWMFQNGYDTRAFVAELIPVIIFETLIRCYWFYKQKFYYGKSFKESLPIANSRELSRLLLVGNATFTSIDTTHATIKGVIKTGGHGVDIGTFVMTVNKPGLVDLGFRSFQNARLELKHKKHVNKIIDEDIVVEYKRVMSSRGVFE